MTSTTEKQTYPLTSSQREFWFRQKQHPNLPMYNIGGYLDIPGEIDTNVFNEAVNLLIQKHDNLRTRLLATKNDIEAPNQIYTSHSTVTVPIHDLSAESDPYSTALAWMQPQFETPFKLTKKPLFHYNLLKLAKDRYFWFFKYHHLIIDGWGIALLNHSLAGLYDALIKNQTPNLQAPSYTKWIRQDQSYVKSEAFQKDRAYWIKQYANIPEPLLIPRYRSQHTSKPISNGCEPLSLPHTLYQKLDKFAQTHQANFFHVFIGILYVYFTYTAQRDEFVIGFPLLNRANAEFKKTAGLFMSVSPVRFNLGRELNFIELIQKISIILKSHYRHQRFPTEKLNQGICLEKHRAQLFDILLSYESHDYNTCFGGISSHLTELLHPWKKIELMISMRDFRNKNGINSNFIYNQAYFNAAEIRMLQAQLIHLLKNITEHSSTPIYQIRMLLLT